MRTSRYACLLMTIGPTLAMAEAPSATATKTTTTASAANPIRGAWSAPVEPFRLVGNIYYVGAANIASYLIATSQGLILVDTGTHEMEALVPRNITKLGFKLEDVKILVTSHAHYDHVEGLAAMKKATGAKVMELAKEAPAISAGTDLSALGDVGWPAVTVDRVLEDGERVELGDVTLQAHWTPGHTPGCTTWTTTAREKGRTYSVVIVGGAAANAGVKLLGNVRHPTIVEDLARTYRVLKSLKPDIWLVGHPQEFFAGKVARLRKGVTPNALVDPQGYVRYVAEAETDYLTRLENERRAAAKP